MAPDLLLFRDQEAHRGFDQRSRRQCIAPPRPPAPPCPRSVQPSFVHQFTRHLASRHWPRRERKWWWRWGHTRDNASAALARLFCCSSSSFCSRRCHRPAPGPTIELQHAQYGYEVGKLISSPSSFQHHSSPTHIIYPFPPFSPIISPRHRQPKLSSNAQLQPNHFTLLFYSRAFNI